MRSLRPLGALAVLVVLGLVGGSAASLGGGLLASPSAVPAAATAAAIVAGVVVAVLLAGPADHWTDNPYW
jgi:hypothetical protein